MLICIIFVALIVDILNLHSLCSLEHAYLYARRKYVSRMQNIARVYTVFSPIF